MPKRAYKKWNIDDLMDEVIIHAKVGLEASPKQLQEAARRIAGMSDSGVFRRAERIAKRRMKS